MLRTAEPTISDLFNLSGRVALITGGCGHPGSAMARALAEAGASAVITSRDASKAAAAARELTVVGQAQHFGMVEIGMALDHMLPETLKSSFDEAISLAGMVDVLVNNGHEPLPVDWTNVTPEQFSQQLANATGYFELSRLLHNHAVERQVPASIIMLCSVRCTESSVRIPKSTLASASPAPSPSTH